MPAPRRLTVDLHGHDVQGAVRLALTRVAEAYQNGYDAVELIHGSADVERPVEDGRGRIKWELRRLASAGAFDRFCHPERTWLKSASVELTLRRNPRPAARPGRGSRRRPTVRASADLP